MLSAPASRRAADAYLNANDGPFTTGLPGVQQGGPGAYMVPEFQAIKLACCEPCNVNILNERFEMRGREPARAVFEGRGQDLRRRMAAVPDCGCSRRGFCSRTREPSSRTWFLIYQVWLGVGRPRRSIGGSLTVSPRRSVSALGPIGRTAHKMPQRTLRLSTCRRSSRMARPQSSGPSTSV